MKSSSALLGLTLVLLGCGGSEFSSQTSGGTTATPRGGSNSLGGATETEPTSVGGEATGGTSTAVGGSVSEGGTIAQGGSVASSGTSSTKGGAVATGGANLQTGGKSTGGISPTAGRTSAAGAAATTGGTAAGTAGKAQAGTTSATGGLAAAGVAGAAAGGKVTAGAAGTTGGVVATGGASSSAGSTSVAGAPSVTPCDGACTTSGFTCCNNACRNPQNDPLNCGECGKACPVDAPVCEGGKCTALTCTAELGPPGTVCCGQVWCGVGQLCCQVEGPISAGAQCLTTSDGTCPRGCVQCVCADPTTSIETPDGPRAISTLRVGDLVYSQDRAQIVAVPILAVKRRPARGHVVRSVLLGNGEILQISARHPTVDGRTFGDLRAGDDLGGQRVIEVEWVTYEQDYTYDILPASDTGSYFAGGALIGTTIERDSPTPMCMVDTAVLD